LTVDTLLKLDPASVSVVLADPTEAVAGVTLPKDGVGYVRDTGAELFFEESA
jgi:hypothetical protein